MKSQFVLIAFILGLAGSAYSAKSSKYHCSIENGESVSGCTVTVACSPSKKCMSQAR